MHISWMMVAEFYLFACWTVFFSPDCLSVPELPVLCPLYESSSFVVTSSLFPQDKEERKSEKYLREQTSGHKKGCSHQFCMT